SRRIEPDRNARSVGANRRACAEVKFASLSFTKLKFGGSPDVVRTSRWESRRYGPAEKYKTEPQAVPGGSEVAERRTPNATILPAIAQKRSPNTRGCPTAEHPSNRNSCACRGPRLPAPVLSISVLAFFRSL